MMLKVMFQMAITLSLLLVQQTTLLVVVMLREPLLIIGQEQLLHTPTHIVKLVLQKTRTGMQVS